ncbi:DUF4097 family beta strand repeat-containing protein [Aquibacillus sediminis]|uniref:DUF4097 family beta strand repeat-containing protein n=1 Tax=Aquibacillus sediminis TaxID=2574734 RepID=UPI0011094252|nr:DUF4097 domain-containing protein [Aquibacillus sediminis]
MNQEQKKILKMVEDGVISSEEASELFDSLEKAEQAKQAQDSDHTISTRVNWEQGEHYHSKQRKHKSSMKSNFFNLLEEAVTKIKNVDLDFNFGPYETVSHIFQTQDADLSKIDMDISNGSIKVEPWEESDVRVECEAKVYQVNHQDQARQRFLDEAEYDITDEVLHLLIPSKQIKTDVQLYVPSQLYQKIALRLFNGSIYAKTVSSKQIKAKTTNGSIEIGKITGKLADLETANGTVKVEEAELEEMEAETINGSIRINGAFEKVDAQAVNGSIHCDWVEQNGKVGFFKTTTGSVRLSLPSDKRIDGSLVTNMGNIHCDLPGYRVIEETKELIKKALHFEANQAKEQLLHLEAETKTGSIWVLPGD